MHRLLWPIPHENRSIIVNIAVCTPCGCAYVSSPSTQHLPPPLKNLLTSRFRDRGTSQYQPELASNLTEPMCRYMELAALIEPGKTPKTDRNLILEDAVRVIGQLRAENNQVRQLNKFLEERVSEQAHTRGQALYQQSLQMQGGMLPSASKGGASTSAAAPPPGTPLTSNP